MVSPTAMTISRMALRASTEPEGPPVPMAYFLSLRRRPPAGFGATAPLGGSGNGSCLEPMSARPGRRVTGEASPTRGRSPVAYRSREQAITEAIEAGVERGSRRSGHASAGIMLGRYDHLLPGSEAEGAEQFDACLDV